MAKPKPPVWKMLNQPEPPVVLGMWEYGTVWTPETHQRPTWRQNARNDVLLGIWSLDYWGRKVTRDITAGRESDPRTTLALRAADRLALALAAGCSRLYRLTQKGEPQLQRSSK
jgi:hypothetical protein